MSFFLQETKCSSEVMEKLREKKWERRREMVIDAVGMAGGIDFLW